MTPRSVTAAVITADTGPVITAALQFLGHSTVRLELGGRDGAHRPAAHPPAGPAAPGRAAAAPSAWAGVDLVLISHLHNDHLHLRSLRLLGRSTPIVVPRGAGRWLARRGFTAVEELAPGQSLTDGGLTVTATAADHAAHRWGPQLTHGPHAPAVGHLVSGGGTTVYAAGDTDLFPGMTDLGDAGIDVALLPVWGWGPSLGPGHLDPAGAAAAVQQLRPGVAVPVHWGTFAVAGLDLAAHPVAAPDARAAHRAAAPLRRRRRRAGRPRRGRHPGRADRTRRAGAAPAARGGRRVTAAGGARRQLDRRELAGLPGAVRRGAAGLRRPGGAHRRGRRRRCRGRAHHRPPVAAAGGAARHLGAFLGDVITFTLCRFGGPSAVRWVARGQHADRIDEVREQFRRHGWQIVVVGRLLPAGRIPVLLAAGALAYPWRRLLPASFAAALVWAVAYALLGVVSGGIFDSPLIATLLATAAGAAGRRRAEPGLRPPPQEARPALRHEPGRCAPRPDDVAARCEQP